MNRNKQPVDNMSPEEVQTWLAEQRAKRERFRKDAEAKFKGICRRFEELNASSRLQYKDFDNKDVNFLINEINYLKEKISCLQNELDPDGLNQQAMKIIRDAAKHLENNQQ